MIAATTIILAAAIAILALKVVVEATRRGVYRYHLVECRWFRVFLHHVDRPDPDRHPHNHPWPRAWSLILWGGYREVVSMPSCTTHRWHFAGMINRLDAHGHHRIAEVLPRTWTLFVAGQATRSWGFMTPAGHVDWRDYRRADGSRIES